MSAVFSFSLFVFNLPRPYRLTVRTQAFQAWNRGSIPRGVKVFEHGEKTLSPSKKTAWLASGNRTAEYVASFERRRAGAQTNFCDGKNLVAGDSPWVTERNFAEIS